MEIKTIGHRDLLLHQVISLGDKNKQTLGMFPEGAFHQHARNRTIIIAIDDDKLAGYLLYRISQKKRLVSITHLCVADGYQGRGVSISLLGELKLKYQNIFSGIMLTCRADYHHASKLWERFGFKARDKKRSRAKKGEHYLVRWIYDFGNPHLFSDISFDNQKIKAVLDSSILIPLSENDMISNAEISALNADWLEDEIEYLCTQEIFNEINRDENLLRAEKTRNFLKKFDLVNFKPDERDKIEKDLRSFISGETPNDISDRKQLAECIASGLNYFITLDQEILDLSDVLYEKYSIEILRPLELVLLLDEISNSLDYRSLRLAGANYDSAKLRGEDVERLVACFCGTIANEKKQDLREIITRCVKDVKKGHVKIVKDKKCEPIAIYGLQFNTTTVSVELIRIKRSKISIALFQQLIRDVVLFSVQKNISLVQIKESNTSEEEKLILEATGFILVKDRWEKLSISGVRPLGDVLADPLVRKQLDVSQISDRIQSASDPLKRVLSVDFERKLWPLKLSDIDVPVYIIPIRPYWASQLFDFYLANASLFGASESLAWSRENIYYRSVHPVSERAPGRILWYLSSEEKATGRSKGIAAASYLDEVSVDRAKDIFRKYKRFGVYEWKDIRQLSNDAIMSEIKALKFSDTEVFKNIIPLKRINEIMLKHKPTKKHISFSG